MAAEKINIINEIKQSLQISVASVKEFSIYSGYTLLKIFKGTGVFFHPTPKRVNSITFAEILD